MTSSFGGKVVIVTGSSNGIGRATAVQFAALGAKLTITGRDVEALKKTRELLHKEGLSDKDIVEVIGDITNEATTEKIINDTIQKFGRIDVLVNNAGFAVLDLAKKCSEYDVSFFDKNINVNLRSVFVLSCLAVPHLAATKGAIVNVSSVASSPVSAPSNALYAVAKAGVDQLTVQLAGELIHKGIRVNGVNPGVVQTDIMRKLGFPENECDEAYKKRGEDTAAIPIGRVGQPDDIAKLIVFLSDRSQSEYIIGQRIAIDGGSLLMNNLLSGL